MGNIFQRVVKAIRNRPIDSQIRVYSDFIKRRGQLIDDAGWVQMFCEHTNVADIEESTDYDLQVFLDWVGDTFRTEHAVLQARRAVNKIRRFYRAQTHRGQRNPIHWDSVQKVKELRDEHGMSFRGIAEVLGKDVRQIHRWYSYTRKPLE